MCVTRLRYSFSEARIRREASYSPSIIFNHFSRGRKTRLHIITTPLRVALWFLGAVNGSINRLPMRVWQCNRRKRVRDAWSNGWPLTIISDLRERPRRGLDSALSSRPLGYFRRHNQGERSLFSIRGLRAERDMKQRHQFRYGAPMWPRDTYLPTSRAPNCYDPPTRSPGNRLVRPCPRGVRYTPRFRGLSRANPDEGSWSGG